MLLSTFSWSVDKHLCMGRVIDIAFFQSAEPCGMEEAMAMMGQEDATKHCCDDESFTMEGQDDLKLTWDQLDVDTQEFLLAYTQSYLYLILVPTGEVFPEIIYPPPLLVQDLNVLHEVFLI